MDVQEIKSGLTDLHGEAGLLLSAILHVRPSAQLVLRRGPLREPEARLDEQLKRFVELDGELIRHACPPSDFNTALRNGAQFHFYTAVRDSVRGLLTDAAAAAASLRNQLDFRGSLALSVVALFIAVASLVLQFLGR